MRLITKILNKRIPAVIAVICIIAGWLSSDIWHFYYLSYFSLDKSINLIDFLSLIATAFLAYYIPAVLSKKDQNTRVEKDYIINKVNAISPLIDTLLQSVRANSMDYKKAASLLQEISLAMSKVERHSIAAEINLGSLSTDIKGQIRRLRDLITGTLTNAQTQAFMNSGTQLPLSVSNNTITFSRERIRDIASAATILENLIFSSLMLVNRSGD
jgi:hypothetical protein